MKNLYKFLFLFIFLCLLSCNEEGNGKEISTDMVQVNAANLPIITFDETEHDFGKMTQGERVKYSFQFKNTGNSTLIISNVSTTCGCTIADKPKDPIAPGKTGKIEVEFNSEGKKNMVERKITVVSNCEPNATTLTIKAEVIEPVSLYSNETK